MAAPYPAPPPAGPAALCAARAFAADPLFVYLTPDETQRERMLAAMLGAMMGPFVAGGGLRVLGPAEDPAAVLCVERWDRRERPSAYVAPFAAAARALLPRIVRSPARWTMAVRLSHAVRELAIVQRLRPCEPHGYVSVLGVDPARQRGGLGGALLGGFLSECDAAGKPAHLETSNPANVGYYERWGFGVVREIAVADAPPTWLMTRPAR